MPSVPAFARPFDPTKLAVPILEPMKNCAPSKAAPPRPYNSPFPVLAPLAYASSAYLPKPAAAAVVAICPVVVAAAAAPAVTVPPPAATLPAPNVQIVSTTTPAIYPIPLPIPLVVSKKNALLFIQLPTGFFS